MQAVTALKQSLLLANVLGQCRHPDTRLPTEVREGFPLAHWLQPSGVWPTDVQPPSLPLAALRALAAEVSAASVARVARMPPGPVKAALWPLTRAEAEQGWLHLPDAPAPDTLVSVRFGVLQKEKVRPIDNFHGSFVNAACGVSEKVEVDSVDRILEAILACLSARLPTTPGTRLVGRTWDKSAYKQLAVRATAAGSQCTTRRLTLCAVRR